MKCLVLGGGGFIGSHLSEALLGHDHAVRIFERPNVKPVAAFPAVANLEWVEGDFLNREDVNRAAAGCEIIFHLISTTLPKSSNENPVYDVETNLVGTLHLMEAARKSGVRKVLFVSSGGTVYGNPREVPIGESHPTDPVCSYGIVKLAIEKYLELYRLLHGLEYAVIRLANPYGEYQRTQGAQGAIPIFMHQALHDETIEIWGDGSVVRDYIYIGDAVEALLKMMHYQGAERVLNIGSGAGTSLNELIEILQDAIGKPIARRYIAGRRFDVPSNMLDISRARDALGWRPRVPLREGIQRVLAHQLGRTRI